MEKKELVVTREEAIDNLKNLLVANADGYNIEGDGKNIVHSSNFPLKHSFADQLYVRQMDMKKDSMVVGAIHNHLHVWFLLTGNLTISTKDSVEDYIAPCYVISDGGTQRAIYANEDSIFVNVHKNPTNTKDISKLEEEIVSINKEKYKEYVEQFKK